MIGFETFSQTKVIWNRSSMHNDRIRGAVDLALWIATQEEHKEAQQQEN
jgi:hypothetical protein